MKISCASDATLDLWKVLNVKNIYLLLRNQTKGHVNCTVSRNTDF